MRGVILGVYMGGSGLVLKPLSGVLEFVSRSLGGVGEAIRAFGDEVTRVPRTRIRSPRQFVSLAGLSTGKSYSGSALVLASGCSLDITHTYWLGEAFVWHLTERRAQHCAGELYNLSWKQSMMARLRKGRFAADEIQDYLQNKDNKALIFTNRHLIYINLKRQQVRWSFSLDNLFSVTTSGAQPPAPSCHRCYVLSLTKAFLSAVFACNKGAIACTAQIAAEIGVRLRH